MYLSHFDDIVSHAFQRRNYDSLVHTFLFLTFMGPCIVDVFFKYDQQDSTLYNFFFSGGFSAHHQELKKLYTQHRVYVKLARYQR